MMDAVMLANASHKPGGRKQSEILLRGATI